MKVLILHFRPKHLYPPLLNMVAYFEKEGVDYILATSPKLEQDPSKGLSKLKTLLNYMVFSIKALYSLLFKADVVLYFESISAIPVAIFFKLWPGNKKRLFIHFHEYIAEESYHRLSFFERFGRRLEKRIFKNAEWISHTNQDRLRLFHAEFPELKKAQLFVMPNYPPEAWQSASSNTRGRPAIDYITKPIKLVHIGVLSFEGMYLDEVLDVFGDKEDYVLDFYSRTTDSKIISRINSYSNIQFKGPVAYNTIVNLKGNYDVGLVLYKGSSLNFVYNVPNKVFEYLALDMDVWCSDRLKTAADYSIDQSYPKMLLVDYENLNTFNVDKAISRDGLKYQPSPYICEVVYKQLLNHINEDTHTQL